MNATAEYGSGFPGSNNISGFDYVLGLSIGIIILITALTLASYFCIRATTSSSERRASTMEPVLLDHSHVVVEVGLDDATIESYPMVVYTEAKKGSSSDVACCSVCLADYKAADRLRMLPDCGHAFHRSCIDPWLRINPTCPVCRSSPLQTPLA